MNNPSIEQFFKRARQLSLSPADRRAQWSVIAAAIRQRPVATWPSVPWYRQIRWFRIALASGTTAMVLITGSGVAYATANSLPGDALYPLKIHLVENVQTVLAVSPSAKAQVALNHVQQRFNEAETLHLNDQLSPELEQQLSANLDLSSQHIEQVTSALETTDASAADRLGQRLEDTLEHHRQELDRPERNGTLKSGTSTLVANITANQKKSVEGKRKAAANVLAEVQRWLDQRANRLTVDQLSTARQQLNSFSVQMTSAQTAVGTGNYAQAFQLYQQTLRQAQALKQRVQQSSTESHQPAADTGAPSRPVESQSVRPESTHD